MAQKPNATESTAESNDQTDVSKKTEIAAERIAEATGLELGENVMARDWPGRGEVVMIVFDSQTVGVNGYQKATIVDEVYQSGANVRLRTTSDGDESVVFEVRDKEGE